MSAEKKESWVVKAGATKSANVHLLILIIQPGIGQLQRTTTVVFTQFHGFEG
jgi:hypothetical protein